jgi:hypothetical protein
MTPAEARDELIRNHGWAGTTLNVRLRANATEDGNNAVPTVLRICTNFLPNPRKPKPSRTSAPSWLELSGSEWNTDK